jgi:NAD-dependent SIR2 family protein deacetylase
MNTTEDAALAIQEATHILLTSGAGMGVDAGLPDFRGPQGLWKAYPPMKDIGVTLTNLTPSLYHTNPALMLGFISHKYSLFANTPPHNGYHILKDIIDEKCKQNPNSYFIYTSNIDGHWERIFPKDRIVEVHGTSHYLQCVNKCTDELWPAKGYSHGEEFPCEVDPKTFNAIPPYPTCKHCGAIVRSNTLLFDDEEYIPEIKREQEGNSMEWIESIQSASRLCVIEIGAGETVDTIRQSENMTYVFSNNHKSRPTLIRINPNESDIPQYLKEKKNVTCISLSMGGLEALTKIKEFMDQE